MWLATLDGFFSTVIDKMEPGRMLIRAKQWNEQSAKELNEDPEIWVFLAEDALDNADVAGREWSFPLNHKKNATMISFGGSARGGILGVFYRWPP